MYVMRLLVDVDLPLNEGLLEPIEIRIPRGLLNPAYTADPEHCPAVVGGNVETSQRLVDTLLEALSVAGCSQGTMNNLSFGDETFGYYETVGGGSGAVEGFDGASGVHTHMTNTRITDPEVLEHRYPVRLHRFAIRRGSGGAGRWRGGDGLVREIEFLAPLEFSILSQHRVSAPYGMAGGGEGAVGSPDDHPRRREPTGAGGHRRLRGRSRRPRGPRDPRRRRLRIRKMTGHLSPSSLSHRSGSRPGLIRRSSGARARRSHLLTGQKSKDVEPGRKTTEGSTSRFQCAPEGGDNG